jgi:hypothetical protein
MLGLSVGKFLLLLLLIGVVWAGFRHMGRIQAVQRALREEMERRRQSQKPRIVEAEDLVKCATCGSYVAARGATACGRPDCPWGR